MAAKMTFGKLLAGLAAIILGLSASAAAEEVLTWDLCVKQASAANPDLAARRQTVRQAEAAVGVSGSSLLPQLSGSLSLGWSQAEDLPASRSWGMGLSAQQLLFDGFKSWKAWQQAQADLEAARYDYADASASIRKQLDNAFISLLFAQASIGLTQSILELRQKNFDLVQMNYTAGRDNRGSLYLAQAQLDQAKADRKQADRNLVLARNGLGQQLGRSDFKDLQAQGDLFLPAREAAPDFETLLSRHPQVRSFTARLESARLAKEMAESAYFPTLSAVAAGSWNGPDWVPGEQQLSTGLNLSWSLITGGKRMAQAAAAAAAWQQAQEELRSGRETVRYQLANAWTSLEQARDYVEVRQKFLTAAEERSRIADVEYKTGLIDFNNWTIIGDSLVSAKQAALSAQEQARNARAAWIQALGGGLENE